MRRIELAEVEGVRWLPVLPTGAGALVLAGSSGRVDSSRAELLAGQGVIAESIRWFGGLGQHDGPWEIPLEVFFERIDDLARDCDRVLVIGTSFGAEAALLVGALHAGVDAVVAFAPSDVVWAGVRTDGSVTSHWTLDGAALPYVPFDDGWEPTAEVPAYIDFYRASRRRFADQVAAAAIPVERIKKLLLIAGGDDQVWPAVEMARAIQARRRSHNRRTVVVSDAEAGHRSVLPGEPLVEGGVQMQRGGNEQADRRIGDSAWAHIKPLL